MKPRAQRIHGDTMHERLQNGIQESTLFGGVGVIFVVVGGYLLSGFPAIVVGGVVSLLWLLGSTPIAIAVGSIGITGSTTPVSVSTMFGGTPTIFPEPISGVILLGIGFAVLGLEPAVTAHQPNRLLGVGSILVVAVFVGILATATLEGLSIYVTTIVAGGVVLFLTGIFARTVTVLTAPQEEHDE